MPVYALKQTSLGWCRRREIFRRESSKKSETKEAHYITVFGCTLKSCMVWWERRDWITEIYIENQAFKQETVVDS